MSDAASGLARLHEERPRRGTLRRSAIALLALGAFSWFWILEHTPSPVHRVGRLRGFVIELLPEPLRSSGSGWQGLLPWAQQHILVDLAEAVSKTVALALLAIAAATAAALLFSWAASRHYGWEDPFVAPSASTGRRWVRRTGRFLVRACFIVGRGIPVYAWAFVLVGTLGVGPWPAILALAIHNAGILGRLFAETIDNAPRSASSQMTLSGAGRWSLVFGVLLPQLRARWALFVLYRLETCVREATVLGLLGVTSLGWFVAEARAGQRLDELFAWVVVGALLTAFTDAASWQLRRRLRRRDSGRTATVTACGPQSQ